MPMLFYINTSPNKIISTMIEILQPDYIISPEPTYRTYNSVGSLNSDSLKIYSKTPTRIKGPVNVITIENVKVEFFTNDKTYNAQYNITDNITNQQETNKHVTNNSSYNISVRADKMGRIYSRPSDANNTTIPICLDINNNNENRYGVDLSDDIYKCLEEKGGSELMISSLYNTKKKIIHFLDEDGTVTDTLKTLKTSSNTDTSLIGGGYKTKMSKLNFNKKKKSKKIKKYK